MQPALDGLLVADLTQNVAGPFCTQILGDLGAEVIKVERPGRGDDCRAWAPPDWGGEGAVFLSLNRNKRSLALDIKRAEGQAVLRRLAARADILVQSFRAGGIEELGLGYERVRAINPRLVYCSVTAFGTRGPLRALPGYDPLMQASSGLMSLTGEPDGPPVRAGTSLVDMGTGMWAVVGILAALRERDRTGQGSHVTTGLFDTSITWMCYHLMGYLGTGEVPHRQGSGAPMIVPYEAFATRDGQVMIAAGNDALFGKLCGALGLADLPGDPRFAGNASRVRNRRALRERIAAVMAGEPSGTWLERLRDAGVPCAPVRTMDQVAADPQLEASGMLLPAPHPRIPDLRTVGLPVEWDGVRPAVRRPPPLLGEHSEEVLRELGYTDEQVARLIRAGVVEAGKAEEEEHLTAEAPRRRDGSA